MKLYFNFFFAKHNVNKKKKKYDHDCFVFSLLTKLIS